LALRKKLISNAEAERAYQEELRMARSNVALQLVAYQAYVDKKMQAEQEYIADMLKNVFNFVLFYYRSNTCLNYQEKNLMN